LIYHEGGENAFIGTAEAVTDAYPDPKEDDASVAVVEIKPKRKFAEPVLLAEIRASEDLGDFDPARLPPLSIMPVSNAQWQAIQELSRKSGVVNGEWGVGDRKLILYSPLTTPYSLELRKLRDELELKLDGACGVAAVVILVFRVVAVLGQAQAEKGDRRLEVFLHRDDRAD